MHCTIRIFNTLRTFAMLTSTPWTSPRHSLHPPSPELLEALAQGDLDAAQSLSPYIIRQFIVSETCQKVWKRRVKQVADKPEDRPWVTRLLVDNATNTVIGRAGFHGGPDEQGMVEIGYEIEPEFRRQGRARDAVRIMIDVARGESEVTVVRATIEPTNNASTDLILREGFHENGSQWDEEDGLEIIYELQLTDRK